MHEALVDQGTDTAIHGELAEPRFHNVGGDRSLGYYIYLPRIFGHDSKVMVCVHGISRNAEEQALAFRATAEEHQCVLIAPRFRKKEFRGYQRLEQGEAGMTPSQAMDRILNDAADRYDINTTQFALFGYSGGAQFAHRYALCYPQRVTRLVVCSAGWYTFIDEQAEYPRGLADIPAGLPDIHNTLTEFLKLPIRVLVGDQDVIKDPGLNTSQRIGRQQGYNRLDRARRWTENLLSNCNDQGITPDIRFISISSCGHSFENCARLGNLAHHIFE